MFFVEIPLALIILLAICCVGFGWGIISNIGAILNNIGIFAVGIILATIILTLLFVISNVIGRKKPLLTLFLFVCFCILLVAGIFKYADYTTNRYDAFYTINDISVEGTTEDGNSISCIIPSGSLISEVDRNTELQIYSGGLDSIPKVRECKYKTENGTYVFFEMEKTNMEKCGWIDCFERLHSE